MQSSSFLHKVRTQTKHGLAYLRSLFTNGYFWMGLGALFAVLLVLYVLVNALIMPTYTRHDATVRVPAVTEQPYEEAQRVLTNLGLEVEQIAQRFNPEIPRDVVVEQSPVQDALVKPGRRVYLTVNTGEIPKVKMPRVEELSVREAEAQIKALGLVVNDTRPDSIPSPYANTVTRQNPAPGEWIQKGESVTLWYSTGLGDRYVRIPDVTGQTTDEAKQTLLNRKLRSVLLGKENEYTGLGEATIVRQSPDPGTSVREGFEVRLYLKEE